MNDKTISNIHWSFWAISVVALIWNVMGVINFFMQMNVEMVASFPESHRAIIEGRPFWATAGFAISVFGGTFAGILLLLKKSVAYYLFIASLIGTVVTMIHTINIAVSAIEYNFGEIVMMILMPLIIAALLIWYTKGTKNKGWLT